MKRTVTSCDVCGKDVTHSDRRKVNRRWRLVVWESEIEHVCDDCWRLMVDHAREIRWSEGGAA